jgi:hypothetical protein
VRRLLRRRLERPLLDPQVRPELGFVGTHAEMNRSASSRRTNNLDWLAKRMVRA